MRYLAWIVTLPIGLLAVLFAVSNRQMVTLSVWPVPAEIDAPVYLAVLVPLVLGLLAGAFVVWVGSALQRTRNRRLVARLHAAEAALREAREDRARERL